MSLPEIDWFYAGLIAFLVIVGAVVLAYEKGWIGGEKRLISLIAETEHALERLRLRLETKRPAAAQSKEQRLVSVKAMLDAGTLTQAQYDLAVAQIVVND